MLALAIGLGDSTPAFALLLKIVPGLGLFRCPGRVFGAASIFIALLAARGLDCLVRRETGASWSQWLAMTAVVWCAVNLAGYALVMNQDGMSCQAYLADARAALVVDPLQIAVIAGTLGVAFFARRLGPKYAGVAYSLAIALLLTDLGWNNVRNFRLEPPSRVALPQSLVRDGLPRRFVEAAGRPGVARAELRYCRLVPAALAARRSLLGTNEGGVLPAATERLFRAVESNPRIVLAVAGCDYACARNDGRCEPLNEPLPRARFFAEADSVVVDVSTERLRDDDLRRMRERTTGSVRTIEESPQRLVIDIEAPSAGKLVLADTWYPGWQATVDDKETAIERAHGVFRGVAVPEGRHRIVFRYDPVSFRLGLAGTLCGLVLWCALAVFGFRQRSAIKC